MKKLLLILISGFFASCSNSDEVEKSASCRYLVEGVYGGCVDGVCDYTLEVRDTEKNVVLEYPATKEERDYYLGQFKVEENVCYE